MKIAIAVIFALVCHMAVGDQVGKICQSSSFYWNGTGCTQCPTGCQECVWKNNAVSCINCGSATGRYLKIVNDIGTCDNCTGNCTSCRGPGVMDCTKAADGFSISPTAITKCSQTGCMYCDSNNTCLKCQFGNRLANGTCTPCSVALCADCSDSISVCKKCWYMTQLGNNGSSCTTCATGCSTCPCTSCQAGFQFNNGSCTACADTNCLACATNTSKCDTCRSGMFANGTCQNCADGCYACTSATQCTGCNLGYVLNGGNCTKCPDNCNQCDTSGKCITCAATYSVGSDSKCIKCPLNCDNCTSTTNCSKCSSSANPDGKGNCKALASCSQGQQLDNNGTCTAGTIDNCVYGNNATASCYQCSTGYYTNGKVCTPCPNGCENCLANTDGSVYCTQLAEPGFSIIRNYNGKSDVTGYQTGPVNTVINNGTVDTCMPNFYVAAPIKNIANKQCVDDSKCTYPMQMKGNWVCFIEGTNAVKITISLFAVVVAAIFTL